MANNGIIDGSESQEMSALTVEKVIQTDILLNYIECCRKNQNILSVLDLGWTDRKIIFSLNFV